MLCLFRKARFIDPNGGEKKMMIDAKYQIKINQTNDIITESFIL